MRQPPITPRITKGTFGEVLAEFEVHCIKRHENGRLADGTLYNYQSIIGWAHAVLGKYSATDPVNGIRPKLVQAALNTLMDRPGQQANAKALLGVLDKWAEPNEMLVRSIVRGVQVEGSQGGHTPWNDPQVTYGETNARVDLSRVISLMAHLGQRGSDVVQMGLRDIEEKRDPLTGRMIPGVNLITKKVKLRLWVPFTEELIELVRGWKSEIMDGPAPWPLVTKSFSETGEPYTRPQLSWHWNDQRDNQAILEPLKAAGLVLHGLRGTCVVRYRKGGMTALEIGSTIGMSQPMVERYCRFADRDDLAIAAVRRLSMGPNGERRLFAAGVRPN